MKFHEIFEIYIPSLATLITVHKTKSIKTDLVTSNASLATPFGVFLFVLWGRFLPEGAGVLSQSFSVSFSALDFTPANRPYKLSSYQNTIKYLNIFHLFHFFPFKIVKKKQLTKNTLFWQAKIYFEKKWREKRKKIEKKQKIMKNSKFIFMLLSQVLLLKMLGSSRKF